MSQENETKMDETIVKNTVLNSMSEYLKDTIIPKMSELLESNQKDILEKFRAENKIAINAEMIKNYSSRNQTTSEILKTIPNEIKDGIGSVLLGLNCSTSADASTRAKSIELFANPNVAKAYGQARADVIKSSTFLSEIGSQGGFLALPAEVENTVVRIATSNGFAARYCRNTDIASTSTKKAITVSDVAYFGEFLEADSFTLPEQPNFWQVVLYTLLHQFVFVMDRSFEDISAVDIFDFLMEISTEGFTSLMDYLLFAGKSFRPKNIPKGYGANYINYAYEGILVNSGVIAIAMPPTKTSFAQVQYSDLINMIFSIKSSIKGGRFVMNRSIMALLMNLADNQNRPLFSNSQAFILPQYGRNEEPTDMAGSILGRPVHLSDWMPTLLESAPGKAFIIYGDFSYVRIHIGSVQMERYFSGTFQPGFGDIATSNKVGIVIKRRAGLLITWPQAFTKLVPASA